MLIKPIAEIEKHRDADGWHIWDEIDYYCPICKRHLKGYREEIGCVNCEVFFDWGNKEPEIEITKTIIWD